MIPMSSNSTLSPGAVEPAHNGSAPSPAALTSMVGRQVFVAIRFLIGMSIVLGIAYPLVVLGIGRTLAPGAANGSLVSANGDVVGSSLIGQNFTGAKWFQGRPSAAGADGYDPTASGGSNLSADSPVLLKTIKERKAAIAEADGVPESAIPPDAVTASGSGLDPDISVSYALIQVNRVAAARHLDPAQVHDVLESHITEPLLGFIGQQRVNVLNLNIALQNVTESGS